MVEHPREGGRLDVFEIPLTSGDETAPTGNGTPPEPNWRRAVAISLVAGSALGIAASIFLFGDDGEPETPAATTLPTDDVSAEITTPPTLRSSETLPRPEDPALSREPVDDAPQPTSSQDRSLFDGVTVPSYPEVTDVALTDVVTYDIERAVESLAEDVPRRSDTHVELGNGGYVLDVSIERDPVSDRFRVTFRTGGQLQEAIVDNESDTTYITSSDGGRFDIPNAEVLDGSTATTVNEYFGRLLLGPVRPDTFTAAATRGRGMVTIGDVPLARQFIANVQGSLIPEWQLYALGPVSEFPLDDVPVLLEYHVYVTADGRIAQVDGVTLVDGAAQLVLHRLTHPDTPIVIELPSEPVTATPSATSETTPETTAPQTSAPPSDG